MRSTNLVNLVRVFLLCFLVVGFLPVEAQKKRKKSKKKERKKKRKKRKGKGDAGSGVLSKSETKQWKKKLKQLTPVKYKNLMTEYYGLEDQVSQLQNEVSTCERSVSSKDKRLRKYGKKLKEASDIVSSTKRQAATPAPAPAAERDTDDSGVVFRVQIGAYRNVDLSQYADQENFGMDQEGDINKYMIGSFRDYREADSFKKSLRRMGVKDAWVVAYRDGVRVNVNDVIQGR